MHHRLRSFALKNAVSPSLLVTVAIRPAAIANATIMIKWYLARRFFRFCSSLCIVTLWIISSMRQPTRCETLYGVL